MRRNGMFEYMILFILSVWIVIAVDFMKGSLHRRRILSTTCHTLVEYRIRALLKALVKRISQGLRETRYWHGVTPKIYSAPGSWRKTEISQLVSSRSIPNLYDGSEETPESWSLC